MAFCTKCGKELRDGDKFCYHCGAPVRAGNAAGQGTHGSQQNRKSSLTTKMDTKKIAIAAGAAVLVLIGVFVGAAVGGGKESAGQQANNQDIMDSRGTDSDTGNISKKADSENTSSESGSSENPSAVDDDSSGQSSESEIPKEVVLNARKLDIIASIEAKPRYGTGVSFEPLVVADDFNGDGAEEMLAVYELKNNNNIVEVMYGLWSLENTGGELLEEGILFTEAGGSSGTAGIVERDDTIYLATLWSEPAGELFNKYYSYTPMSKSESRLEGSWYYMESHGNYTDETKGRYILGDSAVDKSEFDAKLQEFSNWVYELDLLKGSQGDGVMTFDEMKRGK